MKLTDLLFQVASNLIQTLDEHAFLLLSVLDQPEVIQESTNEIGNDLIRFKVYWKVIRLYVSSERLFN